MAVKYLSNKTLLADLHESKKSYCHFVEPWHADYDAIVKNLSDITPELQEETRLAKARPRGGVKVPVESIDPEQIVYRLMTYEHVPLDANRRKSGTKTVAQNHARVPFPAFKHYVMLSDGPREVCRSHWVGGFDNGHFSPESGRMSNDLAKKFMLLSERYAQRGNWRGYSYIEDMKLQALAQLSQVGLQFDESKSDNPFAFYTQVMKNVFTRYLNQEKQQREIRDDLIELAGKTPSHTRQNRND